MEEQLKDEIIAGLKRENALLKETNQMLREQVANITASSKAVIEELPKVLQAARQLHSSTTKP